MLGVSFKKQVGMLAFAKVRLVLWILTVLMTVTLVRRAFFCVDRIIRNYKLVGISKNNGQFRDFY